MVLKKTTGTADTAVHVFELFQILGFFKSCCKGIGRLIKEIPQHSELLNECTTGELLAPPAITL